MDAAYRQISTGRIAEGDARWAVSGTLGKAAYYGALLAVLIFAIPYGTVEPWHKGVLVATISLLGGLRVVDGISRNAFRVAEPLLLFPMVGVLVLAAVQVAPVPFGEGAISRDPYETKVFMLVLGALIVFGEVLFTYTRTTRRLKQLTGLVLVVAIGSSAFGLMRHLVEGSSLDFLAGYIRADQSYAQFINRNHFALLVEMGLGLLVGILLKADLSEKTRFAGWVGSGLLIYSMIAANSRGGLLSLAAMAVFAAFFHVMTMRRSSEREPDSGTPRHGRGSKRVWKAAAATGLCVLVFGIVVILIAFVGGDTVVTRIERSDREIAAGSSNANRVSIWTSTIEMIKERPVLGSGLGAFKTAFTGFDKSSGRYSIEQGHNEYLEIAASGGLIAAALFGVFGAVAGSRIVRNLRAADSFRRACCFGAMIAIFGVMVHSFVDFGLHILVNAMIFVVLIVIGSATVENRTVQR